VRRDLTPGLISRSFEHLTKLEDRLAKYVDMVISVETLKMRFCGVGKLTKEEALRYGTVGPTARASGVDYDIRRDEPYLAYAEIPWKVVTDTNGDVYGRTLVRIGEMQESLKIVRYCLENLPGGLISVPAPKTAPAAEILSRIEAPRGELVQFIRTNNTDKVERLDIRTPTLANWTSVAVSLVNQNIADIPVIVAAIDPCMSCTSRITVMNRKDTKTGVMTWDELRKHGRNLYQKERRA
jgi:NADH-quinone oxidoreductase subunit D